MDAEKIVKAYVRARDAKAEMERRHEAELATIKADMEALEQALLELCKETGQDGGKTSAGTFTRSVKTRYWTSDWDRMRAFIKEHDALELMEQRISQGNMKQFLQENPDKMPEGLNVDSRYSITVRRPTTRT
jgi:phage host-nuclease inhibitor protein Gam